MIQAYYPLSVDSLIRDLGAWIFKGVQIDLGILICAAVAFALLWYATRSTGETVYPQERRR